MSARENFVQYCKDKIFPVVNGDDALRAIVLDAPVKEINRGFDDYFSIFVEEGVLTLKLIEQHLTSKLGFFEVGGGLGFVNAFLQDYGTDILSIEPSGSGHQDYYSFGKKLLNELGLDLNRWRPEAIEKFQSEHKYDVIFSNNVMEHVLDLERTFESMRHLICEEGIMIHMCPNYFFPYEAHLGVPVLACCPTLSEWLFPVCRTSDIWKSLNFITAGQVMKLGKKYDFDIRLRPHILYDSLRRLDADPEFAARHPFIKAIYLILAPLRDLFKYIPASYATPMVFIGNPRRRQNCSSSEK